MSPRRDELPRAQLPRKIKGREKEQHQEGGRQRTEACQRSIVKKKTTLQREKNAIQRTHAFSLSVAPTPKKKGESKKMHDQIFPLRTPDGGVAKMALVQTSTHSSDIPSELRAYAEHNIAANDVT